MAYNPTQMFPGAVDLTDPNFVNGKYKDSSAPGVLDGTPLQAIYFNQRLSMEQAFMDEAGEVYSDSADEPSDSQIATAIKKTYQAINKIKTSQFVVEGTTGDPLPSTTPTGYLVGAEMAFGWVVTTECEQIVVDSNGNIKSNNNTGVVEYTFDKADNGTPNASSLFASVMRCTDAANSVYVQDYADGSNGISLVNETATTITLRIDFSSFSGGKVFGVSEQYGRLEIDSTNSIIASSGASVSTTVPSNIAGGGNVEFIRSGGMVMCVITSSSVVAQPDFTNYVDIPEGYRPVSSADGAEFTTNIINSVGSFNSVSRLILDVPNNRISTFAFSATNSYRCSLFWITEDEIS